MIELAGFDVVGELSVDTLSDFVNEKPVVLPDGSQVYLFGGKFVLTMPLSLPGLGDFTFSGFCDAGLSGIPGTANCQLTLNLTGGSLQVSGATINHVEATVEIVLPIIFVTDPTPGALNQVMPAIKNLYATVQVTIDPATMTALDGALGAGKGSQVESSLRDGMQLWIRVQPMPTAPAFNFKVEPGSDSHDPMTLSADPEACWIDASTLGVFGYYQAAATGGDTSLKTTSDITQPGPEFAYTNNALLPVVPARRVAVLMSPRGFQLTVACPTITNQIIRQLVHDNYLPTFENTVRTAMGANFQSLMMKEHFSEYFADEIAKSNSFGDLIAAAQRAKDRVQADVDQMVAQEADSELNKWLDGPDGQAVIRASVPPSCGSGSVEAGRQHMPDPFPDAVGTLRELDLTLGQGCVNFYAKVDGNLPICGDFTVTQSGQLRVVVDSTSFKVAPLFSQGPPNVDISSSIECKAAAATLLGMLTTATWGTAIAFIGAAVGESLGEGLIAGILQKRILNAESGVGAYTAPLPQGAHLIEIDVEQGGLRSLALIGREYHFNTFEPGLTINATQLSRQKAGQATQGVMSVAATPAGCPAENFSYVATTFDTSFQVSLSATDLALPIDVTSWQMQIGNFEYTELEGKYLIKLPGPYWTGSIASVATPIVTLQGSIWDPEPPLDGILATKNVAVGISGNKDSGWVMRFSGADGCFYAQISVVATAGDGKIYSTSTFLTVIGKEIALDASYEKYKEDCDRKTSQALLASIAKLRPKVIRGRVQPGAPIEGQGSSPQNGPAARTPQQAAAQLVMTQIRSRQAGALTTLVQAVKLFGNGVIAALGVRSR